jgi:hypothetical protein
MLSACLLLTLLACKQQSADRRYDTETGQKEVRTHAQLDSVLATFRQVGYNHLPAAYKAYTDSAELHKTMLSGKTYLVVEGKDIFKFLVGRFRVKDFLSRDKYYYDCLSVPTDSCVQFLLIDPRVLHATLELMDKLGERGLNRNGFTIRLAHRHPRFNKAEGGVSGSRHIRGQAIDILVRDINQDGRVTYADKEIVLDIVENEVIRSKGGVGRYPHSMVVHYDTRGYKARWDKQKN